MAALWFVRGNGKVYGPLDSARLKQIAAEGKINEATEVAQNQTGPWYPAGKVRGLFESVSSTSTHAPETQAYPAPQTYAPPPYTAPQPSSDPNETQAGVPIINVNRRTIAAYYPRSQTGMIATVAALCSAASLVLGYFAGREHLRYQIRTSFEDAGKKFAKDLKEGLGKAFAGEATVEDVKKPEPVAKLKLGQTHDTPQSSLTVTSARMEHPLLKGGFRNTTMKHNEECLVVAITIRNKDSRKQLKLTYGHQFTGKVFTMHDDVGNEVDTMFFSSPGSDFEIVGSHPAYKDVDPEQAIEHFVAFQSPLPKTKSLSLLIDKKLTGQDAVVQYDIPIDAVDGFKGE
jgi:hypothetical protein